jgi:hypothetical protein
MRRLQGAVLRSVAGLVASRRSTRRRSGVAVLTQLDELELDEERLSVRQNERWE